MTDNSEIYTKAGTLMQSAIKKYAEGKNEEGDKDRKLANEYYDLAAKSDTCSFENLKMLYGENRNFGIIYNVFESNVPSLLKTKAGQEFIKKFAKTIKSNKILHEQFKTYNAMLKTNIDVDASRYINETTKLISNLDKDEVFKNNEYLIKLFKENKLDEMVEIDDNKYDAYMGVEYLLLNQPNLSNVNERINAISSIDKYLTENKRTVSQEKENNKSYDDTLSETIAKYENELTDKEKEIVECLYGDVVNKEKLFNETKQTVIDKITTHISGQNDCDTERWNAVSNKIKNMVFNESTFSKDIIDMINVENVMDE